MKYLFFPINFPHINFPPINFRIPRTFLGEAWIAAGSTAAEPWRRTASPLPKRRSSPRSADSPGRFPQQKKGNDQEMGASTIKILGVNNEGLDFNQSFFFGGSTIKGRVIGLVVLQQIIMPVQILLVG